MKKNNFEEHTLLIIEKAEERAKDCEHKDLIVAHVLWALVNDAPTSSIVFGKNVRLKEKLEKRIETKIKHYPLNPDGIPERLSVSTSLKKIIEKAEEYSKLEGISKITPYHLIKSISTCEPEWNIEPGNPDHYINLEDIIISPPAEQNERNFENILQLYCTDIFNDITINGNDPIVGRDKEIRQLNEVIRRRTKNNALLVGEPGVGKTAIIKGLAQQMMADKASASTITLLELNLGNLFAGASYKGELEDRLKGILQGLTQKENVLLFIDEFHNLVRESSLINILKPELVKGSFVLIGATTEEENRKIIEKDQAIVRRFQKIQVEEPDKQTSKYILSKVFPELSKYHDIQFSRNIEEDVFELCKKYIKDRKLPDIGIDLGDETLAALHNFKKSIPTLINWVKENAAKLAGMNTEEEQIFMTNLKNKISLAVFQRIEAKTNFEEAVKNKTLKKALERLILDLEKYKEASIIANPSDVQAIIAEKTGIPLGAIGKNEENYLLKMEEALKKRVIGQDSAVKILANAVRQQRKGFAEEGEPVSFFFYGPTGTGKTELSKALAAYLFGDEKAIIRYDMSEFQQSHAVARLIGAPAGYVGYDEGGSLITAIRKRPFSIVLFDEIEKAHPSVYNVFLQLLDEGRLTDFHNRTGDFSNAIILFTSNRGSEELVEFFKTNGHLPEKYKIDNYFKKEFTGRITKFIPFAPITKTVAPLILDIQLNKLKNQVKKKGINLIIEDSLKKFLIKEGFDIDLGARTLKNVIRDKIRSLLAERIPSNLKKETVVRLGIKKGKIKNEEIYLLVE